MTNVELLDRAIEHVESESVRDWANSDHNRPIFEEIAQKAIDERGESADPARLGTYIVCLAIGL